MNTPRDALACAKHRLHSPQPVEWRIEPGLTPYDEAVAFMEARVAAIAAGEAPELVWLVEHPALYTAGSPSIPYLCASQTNAPTIAAADGLGSPSK